MHKQYWHLSSYNCHYANGMKPLKNQSMVNYKHYLFAFFSPLIFRENEALKFN